MKNLFGIISGAIFGIVMTIGLGLAGAQAESPIINGCIAKNGSLKVVADATSCRSGETAISWNQQGAAGPVGPQGEPGEAALANEQCPIGQAVTGFDGSGSLRCADLGSGSLSQWFFDGDNDSWGDADQAVMSVTQPTGHVARPGDCDDSDAGINPDQEEVPDDGIDNDCDGEIDEGGVSTTWFRDQDGDGFGDPAATVSAVDPPAGHVSIPGDCDDSNPAINPAQAEVPDDGVDNNCDGVFT